jgi:membrane-associated protein
VRQAGPKHRYQTDTRPRGGWHLAHELFPVLVDLVRTHSFWARPVAFTLALAGSLVGTNIFIPVGLILTFVAAMIGPSLALWTLIPWIVIGAAFGGGVSYALGALLGSRMRDRWPFESRPELFERAHAVFECYGIVAVFIGYFIGPLRGPVPVTAGIAGMPSVRFQVASVLSAPGGRNPVAALLRVGHCQQAMRRRRSANVRLLRPGFLEDADR